MIAQEFDYSTATNLSDALDLIANGAKPLAGGMSLIPMMKLRLAAPEHLVDLGRLKELNYIEQSGDTLRIGATTTHYQVQSSPALHFACPLLVKTASNIGDVQVRNMGTIGGSVAHNDPAADYPAALMALEAQVKLVSKSGERILPIGEFLLDAFTTALEPGEIISEVIVPMEASGTGTTYRKIAHPASGFAVVGVAVRLRRSNGAITMARIGITGLGPIAFRAVKAEELLQSADGSSESIKQAADTVTDGIEAQSDLYASSEYRSHLARIATARALHTAFGDIA
jgi:carbon-monoxide dehydrogenase medium subunit